MTAPFPPRDVRTEQRSDPHEGHHEPEPLHATSRSARVTKCPVSAIISGKVATHADETEGITVFAPVHERVVAGELAERLQEHDAERRSARALRVPSCYWRSMIR